MLFPPSPSDDLEEPAFQAPVLMWEQLVGDSQMWSLVYRFTHGPYWHTVTFAVSSRDLLTKEQALVKAGLNRALTLAQARYSFLQVAHLEVMH